MVGLACVKEQVIMIFGSRLSSHESSFTYFQHRESIACGLRVALAIIAACGFAVSICALVSYMPPRMGYCGGAACLCALATLAIYSVSSQCPAPRSQHQASDESPRISNDVPTQPRLPIQPYTQPTSATQLRHTLPVEMYNCIFIQLAGPDLARASLVCKSWNHLASNDLFWEHLCVQENISASEGQISASYDHQEIYRCAQILNQKIRKVIPKELKTPISKPKNPYAFFRARDRIFLYSNDSSSKCRFEMWNASLSIRLFSGSVCYSYLPRFKLIGNTIYFIAPEPHGAVQVYPFDFENSRLKPQPKLHFKGDEKWFYLRPTQFEIGEGKAIVGLKDGSIEIIDLKSEGVIPVCYDGKQMDYTGELNGNETSECTWQASFGPTQYEYVWTRNQKIHKQKEVGIEKGQCERKRMKAILNIHQTIKTAQNLSDIQMKSLLLTLLVTAYLVAIKMGISNSGILLTIHVSKPSKQSLKKEFPCYKLQAAIFLD